MFVTIRVSKTGFQDYFVIWHSEESKLSLQVFLLDSQRGTSAMIDYELEEDRSYIFLIYPPHHEKSANPDLIVTRLVLICRCFWSDLKMVRY